MKRRPAIFVVGFLLLSLSPCFAHHMAVVVNNGNAIEDLTSTHLEKILKSDTRRWPDGRPIVVVLHASHGEMLTLQKLGHLSETELNSLFENHKDSVILVDSDADVLTKVQELPGAIGMVEARFINGHVKVLRVDGKLPLERGYLPD